ncbi:MAG: hypothetical protein Q4C96_08030 [Planctomycetia bacterium]|nr:hypothetical protein [Planctomycetia bacterium]
MNHCLFRNAAIRRHATAAKNKINENLLYLCHFDGNIENAGLYESSVFNQYETTFDSTNYKFGTSSFAEDRRKKIIQLTFSAQLGRKLTVDFWYITTNDVPNSSTQDLVSVGLYPVYCIAFENHKEHPDLAGYTIRDGSSYFYEGSFSKYHSSTWTHIAMTYDGNAFRFFSNGVLKCCFLTDHVFLYPHANTFVFNRLLPFRLDEFRCLRNECAWISNFTPPSAPYNGTENYIRVT